LPNFSKNSPKSQQVKKGQNIYNKPCFKTAYLGKNVINLLKQKVAIILGYFILSKNHNEPSKVA
jgi:hypothetical protein